MRGAACLLAIAALAGCASEATGATDEAPGPGWINASYEVNSWGKPLGSWSISADGTGTWTRAEPFGGEGIPVVVETRAIVSPPGGLQKLDAILGRLPDVPPSDSNCRDHATDMPYGTLALSGGGQGGAKEYAFDTGCLDPNYKHFIATLTQADALVGEWAKAGKLIGKGPPERR
jgi:hypothetical protein